MDPGTGRAAFRIAFFVIFMSALMLPFLTPGTPEFVVDVLALGVGLLFAGTVFVLVRRSSRG
jgi:hypothetical protein